MDREKTIAKAEVNIKAPASIVWEALTDPKKIKQYMFGSQVYSDWKEGGHIMWKGEYQGKIFEDKGIIIQLKPMEIFQFTHFSKSSGQADIPDNYHIVSIELTVKDGGTVVTLTQNNNSTIAARDHARKNWSAMLTGLKKVVEEDGTN
jgi:uncharacterized protein YndB with AHSA1/START domain